MAGRASLTACPKTGRHREAAAPSTAPPFAPGRLVRPCDAIAPRSPYRKPPPWNFPDAPAATNCSSPGELTALRAAAAAGGAATRPGDRDRLRVRPPHADAAVHLRRHPHGAGRRAGDRVGDGRLRGSTRRASSCSSGTAISARRRCGWTGAIPDLFMVSSMGMHSDQCMELIRDARRIDPAHRPLIIAGGPHAVYEPYDLFSADPADPSGAGRRRHRRRIRPAQPARSAAVDPRRRRVDALGVPPRARRRRARRHPRPGLRRAASATASPRNWSTPASSGSSAIWTNCRDPVLGYRLLEPPSRCARRSRRRRVAADRVAQAQPDQLARADLRLQVRLPVLPDPRLQPAAAPREERRAHRRGDVAAEQGVRPALLLRRRRQLLQQQAADARHRRDARPRRVRRRAAAAQGALVHRGDGPRHAADEGPPAARSARPAAARCGSASRT